MSLNQFKKNILELNFKMIKGKGTSGVLLTQDYEKLPEPIASPDILFALETAKNKYEADAVYFRYFQDGRAAVPQLYIFDYTIKQLSQTEKNRIHRNMWNGYQVPAYIIIEKSTVSVFDAREKPNENKEYYAEEIIKKTGDTLKSFNAQSFDDGLFWEEEDNKKHFQFEQSATRDLIRGLKNVYERFQKQSNLDKHVTLKLLVQSLLIKYLEERDENEKSGYFAGTYFKRNFQCENFCDVIRKGKLLDLLDKLAEDFNGKIFEWNKKEESSERLAIGNSEVRHLAEYLDGNIQDGQYVIWRLYSFSHLPVEVISSVYEELLTDSKDIVYTPEMIVGTLVDECMPLKVPQSDFKLIDVSCGSGLFLVKGFKRIVQWWRYEQWQQSGTLPKPSLSVLRELLLKSIHGIDIQLDAVRLSIFSLALAILDEVDLDPPTWGKLRFPDLSENIVSMNFFEYIVKQKNNEFDLVIGNPPFNLQQVNGKEPSRKKYFKELKQTIGYESNVNIPDENPALHFLVQSMKLLKTNGLLCMIQPSGPLFYQKDIDFKKNLFSNNNLLQVIDFTKLADRLWGKTNIATAAIFLQKANPDNNEVLHLIANRSFSNNNRLFLEFDHYDFHYIGKGDIINSPYVWKANLLGGYRTLQVINRLSDLRTLGQYLKVKKAEGWNFGIGFIIGNKKSRADYITGQDYIPVDALTENGINKSEIRKCDIEYFERPRKREIYSAPHILIREIIGEQRIPIVLSEEYLSFPFGIVGINAPKTAKDELVSLYEYLNDYNEFLRVYIIITSGRMMIGKATSLNKEDLMRVPYPSNKDITFTKAERIIIEDINNIQLKSLYFFDSAKKEDIKYFSSIFCEVLNSVYKCDDKTFKLFKIIDSGSYFALHFEYTEKNLQLITEHKKDLEGYIKEIIPLKINQSKTYIQRIMKVYGRDTIILVKPKQLRYWLPSIALRDADESFADYVKARYTDA